MVHATNLTAETRMSLDGGAGESDILFLEGSDFKASLVADSSTGGVKLDSIKLNGETTTNVANRNFESFHFGSGNDTVSIGNMYLAGNFSHLASLNMGEGNDSVEIGHITGQSGGYPNISGGAGTDTLRLGSNSGKGIGMTLSGNGYIQNLGYYDNSDHSGSGNFTVVNGISFYGFEHISGSDQGNSFTVNNLDAGTSIYLQGGAGEDRFEIGNLTSGANVTLEGGADKNRYYIGNVANGSVSVKGTAGNKSERLVLDTSSNVSLKLNASGNITSGNKVTVGGAAKNIYTSDVTQFYGGSGNDVLDASLVTSSSSGLIKLFGDNFLHEGLHGNDRLIAGNGSASLRFELEAGNGRDTLKGGTGADLFLLGNDDYRNSGNDSVITGEGRDTIRAFEYENGCNTTISDFTVDTDEYDDSFLLNHGYARVVDFNASERTLKVSYIGKKLASSSDGQIVPTGTDNSFSFTFANVSSKFIDSTVVSNNVVNGGQTVTGTGEAELFHVNLGGAALKLDAGGAPANARDTVVVNVVSNSTAVSTIKANSNDNKHARFYLGDVDTTQSASTPAKITFVDDGGNYASISRLEMNGYAANVKTKGFHSYYGTGGADSVDARDVQYGTVEYKTRGGNDTYKGGAGDDIVCVTDLTASTRMSLSGGNGNGHDQLHLDDENANFKATIAVDSVNQGIKIQNVSMNGSAITLDNKEFEEFHFGDGNDTITINDLRGGVDSNYYGYYSVHTGDGDDLIYASIGEGGSSRPYTQIWAGRGSDTIKVMASDQDGMEIGLDDQSSENVSTSDSDLVQIYGMDSSFDLAALNNLVFSYQPSRYDAQYNWQRPAQIMISGISNGDSGNGWYQPLTINAYDFTGDKLGFYSTSDQTSTTGKLLANDVDLKSIADALAGTDDDETTLQFELKDGLYKAKPVDISAKNIDVSTVMANSHDETVKINTFSGNDTITWHNNPIVYDQSLIINTGSGNDLIDIGDFRYSPSSNGQYLQINPGKGNDTVRFGSIDCLDNYVGVNIGDNGGEDLYEIGQTNTYVSISDYGNEDDIYRFSASGLSGSIFDNGGNNRIEIHDVAENFGLDSLSQLKFVYTSNKEYQGARPVLTIKGLDGDPYSQLQLELDDFAKNTFTLYSTPMNVSSGQRNLAQIDLQSVANVLAEHPDNTIKRLNFVERNGVYVAESAITGSFTDNSLDGIGRSYEVNGGDTLLAGNYSDTISVNLGGDSVSVNAGGSSSDQPDFVYLNVLADSYDTSVITLRNEGDGISNSRVILQGDSVHATIEEEQLGEFENYVMSSGSEPVYAATLVQVVNNTDVFNSKTASLSLTFGDAVFASGGIHSNGCTLYGSENGNNMISALNCINATVSYNTNGAKVTHFWGGRGSDTVTISGLETGDYLSLDGGDGWNTLAIDQRNIRITMGDSGSIEQFACAGIDDGDVSITSVRFGNIDLAADTSGSVVDLVEASTSFRGALHTGSGDDIIKISEDTNVTIADNGGNDIVEYFMADGGFSANDLGNILFTYHNNGWGGSERELTIKYVGSGTGTLTFSTEAFSDNLNNKTLRFYASGDINDTSESNLMCEVDLGSVMQYMSDDFYGNLDFDKVGNKYFAIGVKS